MSVFMNAVDIRVRCVKCLHILGYSVADIGRSVNKSHRWVGDWKSRSWIKSSAPIGKAKPFSDKRSHCARCLFGLGYGTGRISNALFSSDGVVEKWLSNVNRRDGMDRSKSAYRVKYGRSEPVPKIRKKRVWEINPDAAIYNAKQKKLANYLRGKVVLFFKGTVCGELARGLVGCEQKFFVNWIRSKLPMDMRIEDYGKKWNLDHVIPCCSFDLFDMKQRMACFNYTNYQPLSIEENIRKAGSLTDPQFLLPIFHTTTSLCPVPTVRMKARRL